MPTPVCGTGEIGPFPVWEDQNSASSCEKDFRNCRFKEVCLEAVYDQGSQTLKTKHFSFKGLPLTPGYFRNPWELSNPHVTTGQFDLLFAAYTLETFVNRLAAIGVYRNIEKLFVKSPIDAEISTAEVANAYFNQWDYRFFFGMIAGLCHFASDSNVILHEFLHLLTFSNNRELGLDMADIEGNAMHESISDAGAAIYEKDPEVGEGVAVCLGAAEELSPTAGLRNANEIQLSLFYDEESHGRVELYAPALWFCFKELTRLMGNDKEKASELMTIIIGNMPKFLPARPKKADFMKALYNALTYVMNDEPSFVGKYQFDVPKFMKFLEGEAKARTIFENDADKRYAFKEYDKLPKNQIGLAIGRYTRGNTTFKPSYDNDDVVFFQQYYGNIPIEGAGLRFVRINDKQVRVVPMVADTLTESATKTESEAWNTIRSADTVQKFYDIADKMVKRGAIRKSEVENITEEFKKLGNFPKERPEKVYLSGRSNLQYKFKLDGVTCYVDAVNGTVTFHRQKFHSF